MTEEELRSIVTIIVEQAWEDGYASHLYLANHTGGQVDGIMHAVQAFNNGRQP